MDFSKKNARKAAETIIPVQMRDPDGTPIFDGGKPCNVLIRGFSSGEVQNAIREENRAALKAKPKEDGLGGLEELHAALSASAKRLIVGFENIDRGDKPATLADVDWFLALNLSSIARAPDGTTLRRSYAQQVLDAGVDDTRFLAETFDGS